MRCTKPSDYDRDGHAMRTNKSNNKILLVDDEPSITSLFSTALEDSGFKVDSFNDPLLALDTFKLKNSSYALALLDIKMPGMNGFDLFNQIRKINDKTKVCFITAFDLQIEMKELKTSKSNEEKPPAIIQKPISIDNFVDRVKAEVPSQTISSSKQIHFLICDTCFWCASLVSQVPDDATISNWHVCKEKRICSYTLV
jgi:DNA-binding response OmpR family regulator